MPSQRPFRRSGNRSGSSLPSGMVRDRLNSDPAWQHYTNDGRWICPYCLKDLRSPRSGKSGLVSHIESHLSSRCSAFNGADTPVQSEQAIYDRLLSIYIEDQARSNPAWQVFDHEGYWYSPSSLKRVASVRIASGRFDNFTVQQMVAHLKNCPDFGANKQHSAEQVQQARDNGIRISSLANNLQRVITQNVWRYYAPQGWLCPYCTQIVPQVQQGMNPGDSLLAMAEHLMQTCSVYPQNQRGIQSEATMQQVLGRHQQSNAFQSAPTNNAIPVAQNNIPAAVPVAQEPSPIPAARPVSQANQIPTAAPVTQTPSGEIPTATPVTRTPSGEIPTATPVTRTPSGEIPTATPVKRTPSGYIPIATPLNGTPANPPTTSAINTPATQHNLSTLQNNAPKHTKSGGYSAISDDLDGMIDGFGSDSDDDLPTSGSDNDWITSSTSKKVKTLDSLTPSEPSDALEANPALNEAPEEAPAPEAKAEAGTSNSDHESQDVFGWMDENDDSDPVHHVEENTDLIRAQGLQKNLMHECPSIPGYQFGTRYEACSSVSGDFYEFIEKDDGKIMFAQGDVSGHGVEAGLIMSMARKCLTIFARQGGAPADVVSQLNDALVDDLKGEKFITMCYGDLDPEKREITWVRAGHNPVLRYNIHTKEFSEIKPGGMVVGMKGGKLFRQLLQEEVTQVQSGDVYLVYTDGFNETMNRQEEEFGFERMQHVIMDKADQGIEVLLDHLMNSVRQFRGSTKADDDLTLLALAVD